MNRKTLVLPALAGLLVPVLSACGNSGGTGEEARPIVVGTTDSLVATDDGPAPLDPVQAYDVGSWNMLRGTLQTLMRIPRSGTQPVPEAARSCGFRDQRNEQYRCSLRSGLKFSNGHELTARDVKFSIDRMLTIDYPNGPVSLLNNIDKVETPNDSEVVFHLKKSDATFLQKLATPAGAIVDSEVYPKNALYKGFDLVGSGPYELHAQHSGDRVTKAVFTKNPQYQGGIETHNDKIEMRFFKNSDAMERALRKGDIDLMSRSLAPDRIKGLEKAESGGVTLTEMPGQEIRYLAFNTDDPAVSDKAVRQAMAQIVDRPALVRDVYEYTGDPLYSLVPTGLTGHINSFFNKYGAPSVEAARATLRKAGIDTPVKLTLAYTSDHYGATTAKEFKELRDQFNRSGLFDVTLKGVEWSKFRPAASDGAYPVYGMGWYPDFPDADNYIAPFTGEGNFLNSPYRNAEIDSRLIPATRGLVDRNAAADSFRRAQDILADEVPVLPLWQGKQYVAARDDITGVEWALNSSSVLQIWELGRGVAE